MYSIFWKSIIYRLSQLDSLSNIFLFHFSNNMSISFDFFTDEKKLKAITAISFFKLLRQLKTYLNLTKWFREYISFYAEKFRSLQERKTILFKKTFLSEQIRKIYIFQIKLTSSIVDKIEFFAQYNNIFLSFFFDLFWCNKKTVYRFKYK